MRSHAVSDCIAAIPIVSFLPLKLLSSVTKPGREKFQYRNSVGPTVRIASVHRYAASLLPAGSPTPDSVGPTVRIASVHRYAASLLPAGPPTPDSVGPTVRIASVHRY